MAPFKEDWLQEMNGTIQVRKFSLRTLYCSRNTERNQHLFNYNTGLRKSQGGGEKEESIR